MAVLTSKMYDPGIRSLQLDLTNGCNAACPMCTRTDNPKVEELEEITLEKFKQYFPVEFLRQLEVIKFCGNYGDPAFAKDCVLIHEYVDKINPDIAFVMHTNGGVRNRKFWQSLGEVYAKRDYRIINFHIDGLKDTNHVYRVNVDYDTVLKNASIAIATGASCLWAMIPFAHNEHQIEEAEEIAKRHGFTAFALKLSGRFDGWKPINFIDRKLGIRKQIYPPTSPELRVDGLSSSTEMPVCSAQTRRDIFVDMRGNVTPCCWYATAHEELPLAREYLNQWGSLNLNERSLVDILQSELYNGAIEQSWHMPRHKLSDTCYGKCRGKSMHYWKINQATVSSEEAKWANMKDPEWLKKVWKVMDE